MLVERVCTVYKLNMFVINVLYNKNSNYRSATYVLLNRAKRLDGRLRLLHVNKITLIKLYKHNLSHRLKASTIKAGTENIKLPTIEVFTEPETNVFPKIFKSLKICSSNQVNWREYLLSIEANLYFSYFSMKPPSANMWTFCQTLEACVEYAYCFS